jgi:tRNA threonylcarbamoyladenosine biosynthesis protein TsaB
MTAVFIRQTMADAGFSFSQLDAVAVSRGPGSYTGLRIGVSAAKGLCYAADKPLIAIDTTIAMASSFLLQHAGEVNPDDLLLPLIDARRMEVYGAVLDQSMHYVIPICAEILTPESFSTGDERTKILFGDGAFKTKDVIAIQNNIISDLTFSHSARGLIGPALLAFQKNKFENVAYFEPFYLKEFLGSTPAVKN